MPTFDDNLSFTNTTDYSTSIVCTMVPDILFQKVVHLFSETDMSFSFYEHNKVFHRQAKVNISMY